MTIRRDLSRKRRPLPLPLLGGYVVMVNKPSSPSVTPALATKPTHHRDDLPIAILAAGLVSENDPVFFDNGSEMPLVINMIPDDITFTGICYSHPGCLWPAMKAQTPPPSYAAAPIRRRAMRFYDTGKPLGAGFTQSAGNLSPPAAFTEHLASAGLTPDDLATKRKAMDRGLRKNPARALRAVRPMLRLPVLRRCQHLMC